jgi:NAD(P)-dependent dehydrogenase (short-subunit alcohol dehydrogenase family)
MNNFEGKRVAITGAASGIGKEVARYFAQKGSHVALIDANQEALYAAAGELSESGLHVSAYHADVSQSKSIHDAFAEIARVTPELDILVCAAGILRTGRIDAMSEEDWLTVMGVNLTGVFHTCRAALPLLRRDKNVSSGHRKIALVASASGQHPKVALGAYSASKQGIANLVRVLAAEHAEEQINVNGVAPGTIDTPMVAAYKDGYKSSGGFKLYGAAPIGRMGCVQDVAHAIAFLCSEEANFISGAMLAVDGASTAVFPTGT